MLDPTHETPYALGLFEFHVSLPLPAFLYWTKNLSLPIIFFLFVQLAFAAAISL